MSVSAPILMVEPALGFAPARDLSLNGPVSKNPATGLCSATTPGAFTKTSQEPDASFSASFVGAPRSENTPSPNTPGLERVLLVGSIADFTCPSFVEALLLGFSFKGVDLNSRGVHPSSDAAFFSQDAQGPQTGNRKTLSYDGDDLLRALTGMLQGSAPALAGQVDLSALSQTRANETGLGKDLRVSQGLGVLARQLAVLLKQCDAAARGTGLAADGQEGIAQLQELLQAGPKSAGRGNGLSALPDLIYFQGGRNETGPGSQKPGDILLVTAPRSAEHQPVELLQSLLREIRQSQKHSDSSIKSGSETTDPRLTHFIESRLRMDNAPANAAVLKTNPSILADSVRQVQAVMADMVERMRGDVRFDSGGTSAVLHLEPPYLGRLHIQMSIDNSQRLEAHVTADNPDTRDFLQQNQPDLRQELQRQGFEAGNMNITFHDEEAPLFSSWISGPILL
jgi:flagellar hook-length control protein FliK